MVSDKILNVGNAALLKNAETKAIKLPHQFSHSFYNFLVVVACVGWGGRGRWMVGGADCQQVICTSA